jgi:hypothetical protein
MHILPLFLLFYKYKMLHIINLFTFPFVMKSEVLTAVNIKTAALHLDAMLHSLVDMYQSLG